MKTDKACLRCTGKDQTQKTLPRSESKGGGLSTAKVGGSLATIALLMLLLNKIPILVKFQAEHQKIQPRSNPIEQMQRQTEIQASKEGKASGQHVAEEIIKMRIQSGRNDPPEELDGGSTER